MYAELERKVCKNCNAKKDIKEFRRFSKNGKSYPRPFCKACAKEEYFKQDLWKHYRMRLPEFQALYDLQKSRCACCGAHESTFKRRLHVDHDRETGQIHGLLCTQCNPGIGYFKHSLERLEMAIQYLKKFKK